MGIGLLTLLIIAYFLLASIVFFSARFGQRISAVQYGDVLWPPRWPRFCTLRGDHHIATADRLAKSGQPREALLIVRSGLALSPANRGGRLLLARLLAETGQPDRARSVLLDGLKYHDRDPRYMSDLCALLLRQQEDDRVIELARRQLSSPSWSVESASVLALAAATASYCRGDCDGADQFLQSVPTLPNSRNGRLLAAKIERDRGYGDLALLRLQDLAEENPDDGEVRTEFASFLRRCGRASEALRVTLSFQIAHPTLPWPRLELLQLYRQSGDIARAQREADAFARDFAGDPAALWALADVAANLGDVALCRHLAGDVANGESSRGAHAILVVEALVVARDFAGAVAAGEALLRDHPHSSADFTSVVNSLLALAHFGLNDGETGRRLLGLYLDHPRLRAENLIALAQRLLDVDAIVPARAVLTRAVAADPRNQTALTRLIELDLNTNNLDELPANLIRLLAMRRPSPDVLRVAWHKLGSDRFLFSPERPAVLQAVRRALEKNSPLATRE